MPTNEPSQEPVETPEPKEREWENDEIDYAPRGEGNVKRTNNYDL